MFILSASRPPHRPLFAAGKKGMVWNCHASRRHRKATLCAITLVQ